MLNPKLTALTVTSFILAGLATQPARAQNTLALSLEPQQIAQTAPSTSEHKAAAIKLY